MGCCASDKKNREEEKGYIGNSAQPRQYYAQPAYQSGAYYPPPASSVGSGPPAVQQPSGTQAAPPPYTAQAPPPQAGYSYPPPQVVYAQPPPTVVYQQAPQQQNNGTRNALLGAGAGFIGGAIFADAMDGGLFD